MPLFVIRTRTHARDDSTDITIEEVKDREEAERMAERYRDHAASSSWKVDDIILVQGERL